MKCTNCGAEVRGDFCTECGTPAPKINLEKVNPEKTDNIQPEIVNTNPPPQNQYQNNYQNINQPVYNTQNNVTSVGGWIGWTLLISFLNIIGVIIMLVATKDPSAKNFAKAYLIFFAICAGLAIVILLFAVMIGAIAGASDF